MQNSLINQLNQAFCLLPGVGKKTASRFIYHLLEKNPLGGLELAKALEKTISNIKQCSICRCLTEQTICQICNNQNRNKHLLCVVGSSTDVEIIEQTAAYDGLYFVLNGYLSPIDGVDASTLKLEQFDSLLKQEVIKEVILATNATMEGQVTAHYLNNITKNYPATKISKISHGVPLGGELEYADINTISHAIADRKDI